MKSRPRYATTLVVTATILSALLSAGPAIAAPATLARTAVPVAPAALARTAVPGPGSSNPQGEDTIAPEALLGLPPAAAPQKAAGPTEPFPVSAYVQAAHTVDVALVVPAGSSGWASTLDDTAVRSLVAKTGAYWTAQSNNQVLSLTPNPSIQRYTSPFSCTQQHEAWAEAATKFGHTDGLAAYLSTGSKHLLVLVPADCGGTGLGSLGTPTADVSAANGGTVWASITAVNAGDIVAHEFGHNLGLQHSNTHYCPDASVTEGIVDSVGTFSDGCSDRAYGDAFDVMGAAWSVNWNGTVIANARPTALNIDHQLRLGATTPGEVETLTLPAGTANHAFTTTIASTGAASGRRALQIIDPRTGQTYFVDYRGGGGADAGSLYETGYLKGAGVMPGVRVLTARADGTSVVFEKPDAAATDGRKLYLSATETMSTRSGGMTVRVQSIAGGLATIVVTLEDSSADTVTRLFGEDRFATSAAISRASFPAGAPAVYITNGMNFPDALSAAPVAGMQHAPVLLVTSDSVPAQIQTELARLHPAHIFVIGGAATVSDAVKAQLAGFTTGADAVTRLYGDDRFVTSAAISSASFPAGVPAVYISNGMNFPDALSAAPVAGMQGAPVLLVTSTSLPAQIQTELARLHPAHIYVIGGADTVSDAVKAQLAGFTTGADAVTRLYGNDRFATSAAISSASFPAGVPAVYISNGMNFPDALSAAPVAGMQRSPVLLVTSTSLPAQIQTELARLHPAHIYVIGGADTVSDTVKAQLASFIG